MSSQRRDITQPQPFQYTLIAPVELLTEKIIIDEFLIKDEEGVVIEPHDWYTIPEYIATYGHSVQRLNNDQTWFAKGFNFHEQFQYDFIAFLEGLPADMYGDTYHMLKKARELKILNPTWSSRKALYVAFDSTINTVPIVGTEENRGYSLMNLSELAIEFSKPEWSGDEEVGL